MGEWMTDDTLVKTGRRNTDVNAFNFTLHRNSYTHPKSPIVQENKLPNFDERIKKLNDGNKFYETAIFIYTAVLGNNKVFDVSELYIKALSKKLKEEYKDITEEEIYKKIYEHLKNIYKEQLKYVPGVFEDDDYVVFDMAKLDNTDIKALENAMYRNDSYGNYTDNSEGFWKYVE